MPPLPRLYISALSTLETRLKDAPKEALLRDIERAEGLADQIDDTRTYPEDWVVYRVTGERPQAGGETLIGGAALKAELSSFVERLCDAGRLTETDFGEGVLIDADSLCHQWSMSRQTLSRLRRRGLVAKRIVAESGKPRLMFSRETVAKFQKSNADAITRCAEYSRMGPELEARILHRAARYKRVLGLSLNAAAARIADRFNRSHEAVRQVLKRYERSAGTKNGRLNGQVVPGGPIFNEAEPLTDKRREAVFRAWRLGIDPHAVCRRYRRSRPAVRRAINVARAHRLIELLNQNELAHHAAAIATVSAIRAKLSKKDAAKATVTRRTRDQSPLDEPPVNAGLGGAVPRTINELLAVARSHTPPIAVEERARLDGYHHLRAQAASLISGLDRLFPQAITLDQIETMLRWAARLKVELVRSQLRLMVETLEVRFERKLEDVPRAKMPRLLMDAVGAVGGAIDAFDPTHTARLAAPVGLAVDRLALRWIKDLSPITFPPGTRLRASPLLPNTPDFPDWARVVCAWQKWLEPHFRVREAIDAGRVEGKEAEFLCQRFGWYGGPPRALAELGPMFGLSPIRVVLFEQRSMCAARTSPRARVGV